MERRLVIKQILIMAGGMALLPSCLKDEGKATIQLTNFDVSLNDEHLLGEIAESIIPKTDTPGAKDLKLHLFVLKMLDDCYEKGEQKQFLNGLEEFKNDIKDQFNKPFQDLSLSQRENYLLKIEQIDAGPLATFYKIMKGKTIDGYLNSKYVMTNLIVYELVPGRYNGYFPVKSA